MLPNLKTAAVAGITALAVSTSAMPALAWGKKEQGFVAGVATALIIGSLIDHGKGKAAPAPVYRPGPTPGHVYVPEPDRRDDRRWHDGRHGKTPHKDITSIYATPAAQAFNSYSRRERMAIQRQLRAAGYYRSSIDGAFGPGTYNAVAAYARDAGTSLRTTGNAYAVYDALLY